MTNYYDVLGVPRSASEREIRDSFRLMARDCHPDKFTDPEKKAQAETRFQLLTEAVNVLTNDTRRKAHDFDLAKGEGASTHDPKEIARVFLAKGVRAYREGDFRAALSHFEMSVGHWDKDPKALHYLAMACLKVPTEVRKGVDAIEKAIRLDSMNGAFYRDAGKLYMMVGLAAKAERHFEEALKWMPDDAETRRLLAEVRPGSDSKSRLSSLFGRRG